MSRREHPFTYDDAPHPGINAASAFTNPDKERAAVTISRGVSAYKHRRESGVRACSLVLLDVSIPFP